MGRESFLAGLFSASRGTLSGVKTDPFAPRLIGEQGGRWERTDEAEVKAQYRGSPT